MSSLGTLTVELEAKSRAFVAGMQAGAESVDKLAKDVNKAAAEVAKLNKAQANAAKAMGGMSHAFKGSDIEGHSKKVHGAVGAYDGLDKKMAAANASQKGFGSGVRMMATEMNSALSLLQRFGSLVSGVFKAAEEGARNAAAEQFFKNAGKSIADYRTATGGLISDAQLMKKANLADSMGISEETFKSLAGVAHAASLKTGQSFDYMFNSIIVGTARSSRLLLDNLGIIVSVKTANERFAQSLKESADAGARKSMTIDQIVKSMTDMEKKEAFATEVTRQSKDMMEEYAGAGSLAADKFDRFTASVENLANAMKGALAQAMDGWIEDLTDTLIAMTELSNYSKRSGIWSMMQGYGKGVFDEVANNPSSLLRPDNLISAGLAGAHDTGSSKNMKDIDTLIGMSKYLRKNEVDWRDALAMSTQDLEFFSASVSDTVMEQIKLFRALNKDVENSPFVVAGNSMFKGKDDPPVPPGGGGSEKDPEKWWREKQTALEANSAKMLEEEAKRNRDLADDLLDYDLKMQEARKKAAEELSKAQATIDEEYWKRVADANEELRKEQAQADARALQFYADLKKAQAAAFEQSVVSGIGLAGAAVGGNVEGLVGGLSSIIGGALGSADIGAAIGDILGPLLAPIKVLGPLFEHITRGAGTLVKLGLEPLLNGLEPLGPSLELLLSTIGLLIGSALEPFVQIFTNSIALISVVIQAFAVAFAFLSPIVEFLVGALVQLVHTLFALLPMFGSFESSSRGMVEALSGLASIMEDGAIWINNAMVKMVRGIGKFMDDLTGDDLGFNDFGTILEKGDLLGLGRESPDKDALREAILRSGDATEDNTKAVRDLAREFRNMVQGYKINHAIYGATAPVGGGSISKPPNHVGAGSFRDHFRTTL